jgi:hypothetical protein
VTFLWGRGGIKVVKISTNFSLTWNKKIHFMNSLAKQLDVSSSTYFVPVFSWNYSKMQYQSGEAFHSFKNLSDCAKWVSTAGCSA